MTPGIHPTPDRMWEVYIGRALVAVASAPEEAERAMSVMAAWWWSRTHAAPDGD